MGGNKMQVNLIADLLFPAEHLLPGGWWDWGVDVKCTDRVFAWLMVILTDGEGEPCEK